MSSNITVSDLVIAPGAQHNLAQWTFDDPNVNGLPYRKYAAAELWAATSNDRSTASKVAEGVTSAAYIYTGLAKRYHWIRARDVEGSVGDWFPSSSTAGIVADGVWQNFSPTVTPQTGSFTDASVTSAKYYRLGPNITFAISFDITDRGTAFGYASFTLPTNAASGEYPIFGYWQSTTVDVIAGRVSGSSGRVYLTSAYQDNSTIRWSGTYEAA